MKLAIIATIFSSQLLLAQSDKKTIKIIDPLHIEVNFEKDNSSLYLSAFEDRSTRDTSNIQYAKVMELKNLIVTVIKGSKSRIVPKDKTTTEIFKLPTEGYSQLAFKVPEFDFGTNGEYKEIIKKGVEIELTFTYQGKPQKLTIKSQDIPIFTSPVEGEI